MLAGWLEAGEAGLVEVLGGAGFGTGFLWTGGFLGEGAVSSTTTFLEQLRTALVAALPRSCPSSVSLALASLSKRSAKARREPSIELKSLLSD